jgi:nucleotidyltransferase substrate binding protein (TIGR01987 family)
MTERDDPLIDVRWHQRLQSYRQALAQLGEAVALAQSRPLSRLEQQGLIKAFEFCFELAWNVMKDYFAYQGDPSITGSRDAFRAAFQHGLVADGEAWMDLIPERNRTAHTYSESVAAGIAARVIERYHPLFLAFSARMAEIATAGHG